MYFSIVLNVLFKWTFEPEEVYSSKDRSHQRINRELWGRHNRAHRLFPFPSPFILRNTFWEIHFEKYILINTFWEIHFEKYSFPREKGGSLIEPGAISIVGKKILRNTFPEIHFQKYSFPRESGEKGAV